MSFCACLKHISLFGTLVVSNWVSSNSSHGVFTLGFIKKDKGNWTSGVLGLRKTSVGVIIMQLKNTAYVIHLYCDLVILCATNYSALLCFTSVRISDPIAYIVVLPAVLMSIMFAWTYAIDIPSWHQSLREKYNDLFKDLTICLGTYSASIGIASFNSIPASEFLRLNFDNPISHVALVVLVTYPSTIRKIYRIIQRSYQLWRDDEPPRGFFDFLTSPGNGQLEKIGMKPATLREFAAEIFIALCTLTLFYFTGLALLTMTTLILWSWRVTLLFLRLECIEK